MAELPSSYLKEFLEEKKKKDDKKREEEKKKRAKEAKERVEKIEKDKAIAYSRAVGMTTFSSFPIEATQQRTKEDEQERIQTQIAEEIKRQEREVLSPLAKEIDEMGVLKDERHLNEADLEDNEKGRITCEIVLRNEKGEVTGREFGAEVIDLEDVVVEAGKDKQVWVVSTDPDNPRLVEISDLIIPQSFEEQDDLAEKFIFKYTKGQKHNFEQLDDGQKLEVARAIYQLKNREDDVYRDKIIMKPGEAEKSLPLPFRGAEDGMLTVLIGDQSVKEMIMDLDKIRDDVSKNKIKGGVLSEQISKDLNWVAGQKEKLLKSIEEQEKRINESQIEPEKKYLRSLIAEEKDRLESCKLFTAYFSTEQTEFLEKQEEEEYNKEMEKLRNQLSGTRDQNKNQQVNQQLDPRSQKTDPDQDENEQQKGGGGRRMENMTEVELDYLLTKGDVEINDRMGMPEWVKELPIKERKRIESIIKLHNFRVYRAENSTNAERVVGALPTISEREMKLFFGDKRFKEGMKTMLFDKELGLGLVEEYRGEDGLTYVRFRLDEKTGKIDERVFKDLDNFDIYKQKVVNVMVNKELQNNPGMNVDELKKKWKRAANEIDIFLTTMMFFETCDTERQLKPSLRLLDKFRTMLHPWQKFMQKMGVSRGGQLLSQESIKDTEDFAGKIGLWALNQLARQDKVGERFRKRLANGDIRIFPKNMGVSGLEYMKTKDGKSLFKALLDGDEINFTDSNNNTLTNQKDSLVTLLTFSTIIGGKYDMAKMGVGEIITALGGHRSSTTSYIWDEASGRSSNETDCLGFAQDPEYLAWMLANSAGFDTELSAPIIKWDPKSAPPEHCYDLVVQAMIRQMTVNLPPDQRNRIRGEMANILSARNLRRYNKSLRDSKWVLEWWQSYVSINAQEKKLSKKKKKYAERFNYRLSDGTYSKITEDQAA